jgi:endoglucanase
MNNKLFLTILFCIIILSCNRKLELSDDIRINQLGFIPESQKIAAIVNSKSTDFVIKTVDGKKTVFKGKLTSPTKWDLSGENISIADFTNFKQVGDYILVVADKGKSVSFKIDKNIYVDLTKAAIKAYYLNRSGIDIEEKYAGKFSRSAGHPDNKIIVHPSAASAKRKAGSIISCPYGWYDAGDYNKYIVNSAISVYTLLLAYESFSQFFDTLNINIPESNNNIPDILDEALWNIRWMITMQDPYDGGIYNKCTNAGFDGMIMPDKAISPRYVVGKSTTAALDFAATMAAVSRIYKKYMPQFADSCLQMAIKAWNWAKKNPNIPYKNPDISGNFPAIRTGAYDDTIFTDEFSWAASELYISTKNDTYYKSIDFASQTKYAPEWGYVKDLGFYSLVNNIKSLTTIADTILIKNKIISFAESLLTKQEKLPYKVAIDSFVWGSNAIAANQGVFLIMAYSITKNIKYLEAAISALDYLLGRNATGYCFVTGFGTKSPKNIHHRPSAADGIEEPVPGFLVGGPNPHNTNDCGDSAYINKLPACCYYDALCSYSTNEIAINWNAPLIYLASAAEYYFK